MIRSTIRACTATPIRAIRDILAGIVRAVIVLGAGIVLGACTGSAPEPPPLELPGFEIFQRHFDRAPEADVELPLTLDAKSCTFALYWTTLSRGPSFVPIHPLRERCELWLGSLPASVEQYCLFTREPLVPISVEASVLHVYDDEHCIPGDD